MKSTIQIALAWAYRSFGHDHVTNLPLRSLRVAEEAIELAQAFQVPKEKLHHLIEVVYSRPRGHWEQEIGGVMMTVNVLCAVQGISPDRLFVNELMRCLEKDPAHFTKRNQEKLDLGLDV